uniref:Putative secreted peptide n=1 Tax=Hyalomma excavatum TaxID=257692 RepID=A0A131XBS8_9ACAR
MELDVLVAVCGCLALLFLLVRYGRDILSGTGSSVTYVAQRKDYHPMVQVENPFVMACLRSEDPGGLSLQLWSECPCQVWFYWGLSYAALATWPRLGWPRLREAAQSGSLWEAPNDCVRQEPPISLDSCERHLWNGESPTLPAREPRVSLGVLFVRLSEAEPMEVVALVGAVELVAGGPRLLAQHVKLAGGQSWPLRTLFTPAGASCMVCQVEPASLALLPCRHAGLCVACFSRLQTCPVCRARILSCFHVDPEALDSTEERLHADEQS